MIWHCFSSTRDWKIVSPEHQKKKSVICAGEENYSECQRFEI